MSRSLVAAINAIELADEGAKVSGLYAYTVECGLDDYQVERLVKMPGLTDLGRVATMFANPDFGAEPPEPEAAEEAADDGSDESGSDEADAAAGDPAADDVPQS